MTRVGRKPLGTQHLDKFAASERARLRMRMILETLAGTRTIPEACQILGICESLFHRIRDEALAASLAALEEKPIGRPRTSHHPEPQPIGVPLTAESEPPNPAPDAWSTTESTPSKKGGLQR